MSVPSSILAFVTTTHLVLVALRAHRSRVSGPFSFVTAISTLFAASSWFMAPRVRRLIRATLLFALVLGAASRAEAGQLGALVAPGPLSKAHASIEGGSACIQCHEAARKVTAGKCLACHKPIQERIARKSGVHRAATECVQCHTEHAGADAEIRRINQKTFDHAVETGYALDGRHAALAENCASCHKTRSCLEARPVCSTCHADPHKSTLGPDCTSCHSTDVRFKDTRTRFDHGRARFALTGAHRELACEKCHAAGRFRGVPFAACTSCHQEPHKGKFGPSCTTCHVTDQWATKTVEHGKTRFPLAGAHAQVACAKCHQASIIKPIKSDTCASCHADLHRGSVKGDCRACHTEKSFAGASFDHAARAGLQLVGRHEGLECRKCHTTIAARDVPLARKVINFGGADTQCVSCHADKHKGEYGLACDSCHRPAGFSVSGFTHPRAPEFYAGQHAAVACVRCHMPDSPVPPAPPEITVTAGPAAAPAGSVSTVRQPKTPSMTCASCHADPHLGQVGVSCERCHAVDAAKFKAVRFGHETAAFPLTGRHQSVDCAKCHTKAVRAYPSGNGSAVQLHPIPADCRSCHQDQHLGQVDARCETCHSTSAFKIPAYTHKSYQQFFAGNHGKLSCAACHKKETGTFPAGPGTTVRFRVGTTCVACHEKV